ncbi:MAG: hypothetical protein K1X64_11650 [Myxococcaceae bacterium]|nr:hypothetical protein [Myxococcaceae bacterium]
MLRNVCFSLVFSLCACGGPSYRSELQADAVVPGSASGGLLPMCPPFGGFLRLDFDNNAQLRGAGRKKSEVRHAFVESASLKIVSPAEQDFGFIDKVQLVASAANAQVTLARKDQVADAALAAPYPTLTLPLEPQIDLGAMVAAPQLDMVVRCEGRVPPADTRLEAKVVLRLELEP